MPDSPANSGADQPDRSDETDLTDRPVECPRCGKSYDGGEGCPWCGALADRETRDEGRCVVCGRAVRNGEPQTKSNPYLCSDHRTLQVIEGWSQVYSTSNEWEARLIRENLQAEGIDSQIFSQRDSMFSVDLGELSIVRLLVPVWNHEAALTIIQQHMDVDGEVSFADPPAPD
jgi:hypothetical protein